MTQQRRYEEDIAQMKYIDEWFKRKEERKAKRRKLFNRLFTRRKGSAAE
jgi:hypothetical protein